MKSLELDGSQLDGAALSSSRRDPFAAALEDALNAAEPITHPTSGKEPVDALEAGIRAAVGVTDNPNNQEANTLRSI